MPMRMPWGAMLDDLVAAGHSLASIAEHLGAQHSTVRNWRTGEPGHGLGAALIDLHHMICGEELAKLRLAQATPRG